VDLQIMLAGMLLQRKNTDRAHSTLRHAARLASYDESTLMRIANLQMRAEDHDGARWSLTKLLAEDSTSVMARAAMIELEISLRNHAAAAALIDELRSIAPTNPAHALLRAKLHEAQGELHDAIIALDDSFALQPAPEILQRRVQLSMRIGDFAGARQMLQSWLNGNPDDLAARHAVAVALLKLNEVGQALVQLESLVALEPKNVALLNNFAWALYLNGDARSLDYAKKAYELAPKDADALDTYGWLLVEAARSEEGLALLRDALARNEKSPSTRYHLAVALHRTGRDKEALSTLQKLLADETDFEDRAQAKALVAKLQP
jgi:cellulose synthase operon protein C